MNAPMFQVPVEVHGPCVAGIIGHDESTLVCPACGCDYSHIKQVSTRMGSDAAEAEVYAGTVAIGETASRRSALVIELDGECSHSWRIVIQQHKGNNFVAVEVWERWPIEP